MSDFIRLENIVKKFYVGQPNELEILHGINLTVNEGEFLSIITKEESVLRKLYIKYFCSSMVSSRDRRKRMSFFFLLKYLKSEGYWIKIIDRSYGFTTLEKRVELAFGSGSSDYVRKSPSERRKERKKDIIITIITILIGLALGVLLPIRR